MIKKVACITSGGDASGINAALYSLVLSDLEVIGFQGGFSGIVNEHPIKLSKKELKKYRTKGELFLKSGRSELPKTIEGIQQIKLSLLKENVDTLVVFGGDGSAKGVKALVDLGVDAIHIPMTIDNDIFGTDYTIGHMTAVEQIHNQVANLHQTGSNLPNRIFIVETFGALSGQLTLLAGIVGGANIVLLPEYEFSMKELIQKIEDIQHNEGGYLVILCTESAYRPSSYSSGDQGMVAKISQEIEAETGERVRQTILGYTQRAGDPCTIDILQATRMGTYAAEKILKEESNFMVGMQNNELVKVNLDEVTTQAKELDDTWIKLGQVHNLLIGKGE
ncbi:6-phosphofructokinase [Halobacillus karajensis]|uniref:6-phosphofructokinase n=1 Tax=Halobacillus karajensis TaxID=195088 RepID=UPI0008A750E7|nr:ATP-dependent 6-phosphofructokinase [Halobacillus karajensis]SEI13377.1 6-phosphofructokinase [Halobacillus karajensis]